MKPPRKKKEGEKKPETGPVYIEFSWLDGDGEKVMRETQAPDYQAAVRKAVAMRERMAKEGYREPRTRVLGKPPRRQERRTRADRAEGTRPRDFTGRTKYGTVGSKVKPDWLWNPEREE